LETNIPVLVYEYIRNGSLFNLLHVDRDKVLLLRTRLNIAIGSSEALAYMHSHGDRDRIHCDVKTANILLTDNLMPTVSDFGSSRLLSNARYATAVQADMSYMDPLYMMTDRFLPKSDVYSFGIVLLELITRKTVRYGKDRSLPVDFVKSCKDKGNARELYDGDQCHNCVECLDKIGALAVRCLRYDVDERPTMADVVDELTQAANLVDNCKLANVSQHTVAQV
jgi:serine/threonine protein kinase